MLKKLIVLALVLLIPAGFLFAGGGEEKSNLMAIITPDKDNTFFIAESDAAKARDIASRWLNEGSFHQEADGA